MGARTRVHFKPGVAFWTGGASYAKCIVTSCQLTIHRLSAKSMSKIRILSSLVVLWFGMIMGSGVGAQQAVAGDPLQPVQSIRVIGGLAGVSQYTRLEEPFWSRDLARLSGGKYTASIVPFDKAGVPGADMLRLLQLGVVPFGTVLMSSLNGRFPQYAAPDLAGLSPDMQSLRANVAAFRPYLERALREEQGIEALALYIYPAQMLFCKKPIASLSDMKGWRVRVSSASQSDFVAAWGAIPVHTEFAQIVSRFEAGSIDCAITGTLSGNTIGLPAFTTHLYALPFNWGMAVFGANSAAWNAIPGELRDLLRRELPKLEAAIWAESERDTTQGLACNGGQPGCVTGKPGKMRIVPATAADKLRSREMFTNTVLPRWLERCGARCDEVWTETIGPMHGVAVRSR